MLQPYLCVTKSTLYFFHQQIVIEEFLVCPVSFFSSLCCINCDFFLYTHLIQNWYISSASILVREHTLSQSHKTVISAISLICLSLILRHLQTPQGKEHMSSSREFSAAQQFGFLAWQYRFGLHGACAYNWTLRVVFLWCSVQGYSREFFVSNPDSINMHNSSRWLVHFIERSCGLTLGPGEGIIRTWCRDLLHVRARKWFYGRPLQYLFCKMRPILPNAKGTAQIAIKYRIIICILVVAYHTNGNGFSRAKFKIFYFKLMLRGP